MKKRKLLFVTYGEEGLEAGFSYAVELAKALYENIALLLLRKNGVKDSFENLMSAVTFAEAGEHETAMSMLKTVSQNSLERKVSELVDQCGREGVGVSVHTSDSDAVKGIKMFLKEHSGVDKVVLSPVVTEDGQVSSRDLNRLVRTASRPIVTMTRQACVVA
ncbi:MAG: hypothetical protein A2X56_11390 [Nitrospirae bacterium GWC2_57_13]|nr:MAG: hypothetical protein A2072_07960 [Nitrospirae bacterium GWC1_57_7]OGW27649.1 MAG: hypothetical protein A2X56_11390 [Nitrospirae bacterium GWC2_57_13]OGW42532.1 MAG: hypothetical protein A2X57_01520 [Nitrospirae bacterium GWD2_57_8]HAR46219.1 hypothetical protein [Nitrospiraceae bacterium]HAS55601.1 hypothetical protein [Nitrospiraceae bacterium]